MPDPNDIEATTEEAIRRGYTPLPILPGTKRPALGSWQSLDAEANPDDVRAVMRSALSASPGGDTPSIGLSLGAKSGGLVDIDLDDRRALRAARHFLPPTSMKSGRLTNPASHWWYRITEDVPERTDRRQFPRRRGADGATTGGEVIVELRTTGGQTVIPPSLHPSGEPYEWVGEPFGGDEGPRLIGARDLRARFLLIALVVTLAEGWPTRGGRHDAYLALAGMMLREKGADGGGTLNPVWSKNAPAIIGALADVTVDDDGPEARIAECIPSTLRKIEEGAPTQGYPTLATLLPEDLARSARGLLFEIEQTLGYERSHVSTEDVLEHGAVERHDEVYEDDEGTHDGAEDGEEHREPVLLDLTNTYAYKEVVSQARRLQIQDEARRLYNEALYEGTEVELDLQPLELVLHAEPDPEPRVEGFVPWDGGTLLVAQAKTGKTTMCLNMARSLLTGEPFLGKFDVRPVEPHRRVAMLNFEMSPAQIGDWCLRRELPRDRFLLLNQKGKGNPFRREQDRERLAALLREWDVETLFVDTFAAVYVGESQNDANEVRPWLEALLTLTRGAGVNDLILTAHAGHDGSKPRGSTALADWADQMVFLTCDDPTDKSAPRYVHTAGRIDGIAKVTYTHDEVSLEQRVMGDISDLPPSTSIDLDPTPLVKAREAIIEVLLAEDGRSLTSTELEKRVQMRSGCSREIARSAKYEATNGGWVLARDGGRNTVLHRLADDHEDLYREAFPDED